jgi:hypothetical protein
MKIRFQKIYDAKMPLREGTCLRMALLLMTERTDLTKLEIHFRNGTPLEAATLPACYWPQTSRGVEANGNPAEHLCEPVFNSNV